MGDRILDIIFFKCCHYRLIHLVPWCQFTVLERYKVPYPPAVFCNDYDLFRQCLQCLARYNGFTYSQCCNLKVNLPHPCMVAVIQDVKPQKFMFRAQALYKLLLPLSGICESFSHFLSSFFVSFPLPLADSH